MGGNNKGKTLHSLEELKGMVTVLQLPQLDVASDDIGARAAKIREGAAQIREWVITTLGQLDAVKGLGREERELLGIENLQLVQQTISSHLRDATPAYRRGALLGLFAYEFGRELKTREETEALFRRLVTDGHMAEDPSGTIKVYNKTYAAPGAGFDESELKEIQEMITGLLGRVYAEVGKQRTSKLEVLRNRATSRDINALIACEPGWYLLEVPAQQQQGPKGPYWLGGGTLLVESDGEIISPRDAIGAIERGVLDAKQMCVHLLVGSLSWDKAPLVKKLSPEMGAKVQLLWHLLKRAERNQNEKDQLRAQHDVMQNQATVSAEDFLLNRATGICFVEFLGTWEQKDRDGKVVSHIDNVFCLVERTEGEEKRIALREIPSHIADVFKTYMDQEYPEGDKFAGVPGSFKALLQAAWRQTSEASKDAMKTAVASE